MNEILENKEKFLPFLQSIRFFKVLSNDELAYLLSISNLIEYKDQETIIEEGEMSNYLYVIVHGSVSVNVKQDDNGNVKDVYICTIGEGDIIGEAAIFDNVKRTADVVAKEDITMMKIERGVLINFLKKYPKAGIKLLMLVIHSLLNKLKEVNHELAFERKAQVDQTDIDSIISNFVS